MSERPVHIAAIGMVTPLGRDADETWRGLIDNRRAIAPLTRFAVPAQQLLPVGEAPDPAGDAGLPRTHRLALAAAGEAMRGAGGPPEAGVVGTTPRGMEASEWLLREGVDDSAAYRWHGLHTVCATVAAAVGCSGPALTVSTACSSGTLAIALALAMLRRGTVRTVLAGGVDSLCRLTYYGFHSLQLVDRQGCRPLDRHRRGMAVAEGAALLLLTTESPDRSLGELRGAGLSCDAYHPAAPHPEGQGALLAMRRALEDAGLAPEAIDYVNLHGTGTPENDAAEAMALRRLFAVPPPLSSIKGALGHGLAAAGAVEAAVAALAVSHGLMPGNTGLQALDEGLGLTPLTAASAAPVKAVLSNSFGFGGNNGALVIAAPGAFPARNATPPPPPLTVSGYACLSGAGDTSATLAALADGGSPAGAVPLERLAIDLPAAQLRRLKRLPRLVLALAGLARREGPAPGAIFAGSGWGGLSETHDFLQRLFQSGEQFPSPTDFVGSVHNGPAGQAAILCQADGPNVTMAGGEASFAEALLAAEHLFHGGERPALLVCADEGHPRFSPLFDPGTLTSRGLCDGGGALLLQRGGSGGLCTLRSLFHGNGGDSGLMRLAARLSATPGPPWSLVLADIPQRRRDQGRLRELLRQAGIDAPLADCRRLCGEFASASAVAAVLAVAAFAGGAIPAGLVAKEPMPFDRTRGRILLLGLGETFSAVEFCAC